MVLLQGDECRWGQEHLPVPLCPCPCVWLWGGGGVAAVHPHGLLLPATALAHSFTRGWSLAGSALLVCIPGCRDTNFTLEHSHHHCCAPVTLLWQLQGGSWSWWLPLAIWPWHCGAGAAWDGAAIFRCPCNEKYGSAYETTWCDVRSVQVEILAQPLLQAPALGILSTWTICLSCLFALSKFFPSTLIRSFVLLCLEHHLPMFFPWRRIFLSQLGRISSYLSWQRFGKKFVLANGKRKHRTVLFISCGRNVARQSTQMFLFTPMQNNATANIVSNLCYLVENYIFEGKNIILTCWKIDFAVFSAQRMTAMFQDKYMVKDFFTSSKHELSIRTLDVHTD